MRTYTKPELDVLELDVLDVIQLSLGDGDLNLGDGELELNSIGDSNNLNLNYFDAQ